MSIEQEHAQLNCPKCGAKTDWPICRNCGLSAKSDTVFSVGDAPPIDLKHLSYADWLKSKNIYIWIKDKR